MEKGGFEFSGELRPEDHDILTDEALAFLGNLVDRFAGERAELMVRRKAWQDRYDAGELPNFRPETAQVRAGDWKVGKLPADLLDRRVEITGPVDKKMIINALNA